ncbi:MAG: hypothetical protein M1370_02395 [Bacteroidetes bacterium]|nr:hypothetical protein [Bacteroidota bacterium]
MSRLKDPENRRRLLLPSLVLGAALATMLWVQSWGFPLEVDHYKFWTKLVTDNGVQAAYSGTFPHTYAIYPPVNIYFYWGIGQLYRARIDPTFDIERALSDSTLTSMIKAPGIVFHLLTALLIYLWVSKKVGERAALLAMAGYALNPGMVFDIAVWGQPDSVHSFFAVLAVLLLSSGRPAWGGAAFALAALTKPQTWVLAPLLVFFDWRKYGLTRTVKAGLAGLSAALLVAAPFFWYGTWDQLLKLPLRIASVAPFVSANADNLWWLVVAEHASVIPDFEPYLFGISYATFGMLLVGASVFLVLARLGDAPASRTLPAMAAFQCFAFFMLTTKAHENHAFLVFPLLSLVWVRSPALRWAYLALSLTFLANLVLYDPTLGPAIGAGWLEGQLRTAQRLNALANVLVLAAWAGRLLAARAPRGREDTPAMLGVAREPG